MGGQGKKLVDTVYDWNTIVDELLDVYESTM
jgi:hypothetical protein